MSNLCMFGVVRRKVPLCGVKIGCTAEVVGARMTREAADELADMYQPAEEQKREILKHTAALTAFPWEQK